MEYGVGPRHRLLQRVEILYISFDNAETRILRREIEEGSLA